jgi:hypothetical protein
MTWQCSGSPEDEGEREERELHVVDGGLSYGLG